MAQNRDWAMSTALKLVNEGLSSGAIKVGVPEMTGSSMESGKAAGIYLGALIQALSDELQKL